MHIKKRLGQESIYHRMYCVGEIGTLSVLSEHTAQTGDQTREACPFGLDKLKLCKEEEISQNRLEECEGVNECLVARRKLTDIWFLLPAFQPPPTRSAPNRSDPPLIASAGCPPDRLGPTPTPFQSSPCVGPPLVSR